MAFDPAGRLAEWLAAGVIDADTADRIRAFEATRATSDRWHWPMVLALSAGGLLTGAGVLLFVAAHWDDLSPAARFSTVLALVASVHVSAAVLSTRSPALAATLHAVGTIACGAAIYVSGQIFNLAAHWPGGVMLWAAAAFVAWLELRAWPQLVIAAVLVPAWLGSEWTLATADAAGPAARVLTSGLFLSALAYLSAGIDESSVNRRALVWVGALSLLPTALGLAWASQETNNASAWTRVPTELRVLGWSAGLGLPLVGALALRGRDAWPLSVAALWTLVLLWLGTLEAATPTYAWWAGGAIGLAFWGVSDRQSERINLGAALFAATVVAFYFSEVMDRLGRSASLIGLGLLFLGGGWLVERTRRDLVRQAREPES